MPVGQNLWEEEGNEEMREFCKYIEDNWLIVPTNNQLTERWVKDSNACTHNNQCERFLSLVAMVFSSQYLHLMYEAKEMALEIELKWNQHMGKRKVGEHVVVLTREIEQKSSADPDICNSHTISYMIKQTIDLDRDMINKRDSEEDRKRARKLLLDLSVQHKNLEQTKPSILISS